MYVHIIQFPYLNRRKSLTCMFWNENMGSVGGGGDRGLLVYGFGARDKGPEIGLCYGIMIQEIGLSKQCCSFKPKMRVNQ